MTSRKKGTSPTKKAAKKKAAPSKKSATKKPVAKKKTAAKKSIAPKKKTVAKKTTTPGKKSAKKAAAPGKKKSIKRKVNTAQSPKLNTSPKRNKADMDIAESNLPPVEEKSTELSPVVNIFPEEEQKNLRRRAAKNYDKHHIPISSVKKGGPKPAGKKPLW